MKGLCITVRARSVERYASSWRLSGRRMDREEDTIVNCGTDSQPGESTIVSNLAVKTEETRRKPAALSLARAGTPTWSTRIFALSPTMGR